MFRDSKGHLFMSDDTLRAYKAGILPVIKARVSRSVCESREMEKNAIDCSTPGCYPPKNWGTMSS